MKRREFLAMLGGTALAGPGLAQAQAGRTYHLGTLTPVGPINPESLNGKILLKAIPIINLLSLAWDIADLAYSLWKLAHGGKIGAGPDGGVGALTLVRSPIAVITPTG